MSMNEYTKLISNHIYFVITVALSLVIGAFFVFNQDFQFTPLREISDPYSFSQFGLGIQSVFFLLLIAFYLLNRWKKSEYTNTSNLVFGLSFLAYTWLFIFIILSAFKDPSNSNIYIFSFANIDNNITDFFISREAQIIWTSGMLLGILFQLTSDKKMQLIPPILIFLITNAWFIFKLYLLPEETAPETIVATMYVYLFICFIPVCLLIGYLFYTLGTKYKLLSPRFLGVGFYWLAFTYVGWGLWRISGLYMYIVMFFLFVIALVLILIGFILTPWEQKANRSTF